ncbi:hypothetical protein BD413DRAFT_626479 [Trametes elegans]|nr:hypothetical protein BD413DRAFT_626479 [Trametes elegans]
MASADRDKSLAEFWLNRKPGYQPPIHPQVEPEAYGEKAIQLGRHRSNAAQFWSDFWTLPVLGAIYLTHVRYRRHIPRRVPLFTSMGLRELYSARMIMCTIIGMTTGLERDVMDDPHLHLIENVARSIRRGMMSDANYKHSLEERMSEDVKTKWLAVREESYKRAAQSGILARLRWWHNHIWADRDAYVLAAIAWNARVDMSGVCAADLDICITHVANTCAGGDEDDDRPYVVLSCGPSVEQPDRLRLAQEFGHLTDVPFYAVTPLAMLARGWTRARRLARPLNGLQRLCFWASVYPAFAPELQHYAHLRGLRAKRAIGQRIRSTDKFYRFA